MKKNTHTFLKRSMAYAISILMLISMMPTTVIAADTQQQSELQTVNPMLAVTGTELLDSGYSNSKLAGIANEKSYTLEELKSKETVSNLYSAINSYDTKSLFLGKGIKLSTLLSGKNVKNLKIIAKDGFSKTYNIDEVRYYYPDIAANKETGKKIVEPILAWEEGGDKGSLTVPTTTSEITDKLKFMTGQTNVADKNNPMFVSGTNKILAGDELPAILSVGTKNYRRDELLLMPRADRIYTYATSGSDKTDYVRGVPLNELLKDVSASSNIKFVCADEYETKSYSMSDLISKNYILAYEKGTSKNDLTGIYENGKGDNADKYGYLTLYGDGDKPVKMICKIAVETTSGTDYTNSPYKHITNGGNPDGTNKYNVDAITGATLTIEGPGVTKSIPMSVRELENQNNGVFRGEYTDTKNGKSVTQTYEGISLYHVLNNMKSGDSGIILTDDAAKIEIKNRVRQTIATFTLAQVKEAEENNKPIIISYGTSSGNNIRPFVYDGDININSSLGNGDGCIKLIYDKNSIKGDTNTSYANFSNMAYIYVSEEQAPGYKHDKAPYDNAENTSYIFSVTGDKIGRELNFTVKELEAMTDITHKDEYSLANSNYWYVQEYEGIKLWDLLLKSKLPSNTADNTPVSFTTADNYKDVQKFTVRQLKDPNLFGYYEKNPADNNDGLYKSTSADLKDSGYPVLVAYGVNGYPYVVKNNLDGYKSGLGNDGGPLRIIFGKSEYAHANGSQQAKFVDSAVVGSSVNYSTHKYNPSVDYQALADDKIVVTVKGTDGSIISDKSYTVAEIEDMIYGSNVSNQEKLKAKVKDFYAADLYEGVNLGYFITEKVGLPGTKGTVTFKGQTADDTLTISIQEALEKGINTQSGKTELSAVLAFAKNGSPMVADKNSAGYEKEFVLTDGTVKTIKNDGGPLSVILPQKEDGSSQSLKGVTSIEINLAPDKYSHASSPYSSLADSKITISGEGTRLASPKTFTVGDLEGKQNYVFTGEYNIKSEASEKQVRFRGIDLYAFLNSVDVGLKSNADKVKITCSDNENYEFNLADIIKSDYINEKSGAKNLKVILAYGSAPVSNTNAEEGKPLVLGKSDAGYDASYENNGGPLKLVVGQTDTADVNSKKILKDVVKIEVSASGVTSQKHDINAIYNQYSSEKLTLEVINGKDVLFNKSYTVKELESMQSIIHRDLYTWVGEQEHEGVKVWQLIMQEAGKVPDIDNPVSVKAFANDGFSKDILSIFGKDALENGVKDGELRKPIVLAYSANGYPLVPTEASDGYVGASGNAYGPIRLITHGNQGACLKNTVKIVVELSGESVKPALETAITVTKDGQEPKALDIRQIKGLDGGKASSGFNWFDKDAATIVKDNVKGIFVTDLAKAMGIEGDNYTVNLKTTDGFDGKGTYLNIPYKELKEQNYFIAYDVNDEKIADLGKDGKTAYVRVYRDLEKTPTSWMNRCTGIVGIEIVPANVFTAYEATDNAGELPSVGVRSITFDADDGMWVGTYGGGAAYLSKDADKFDLFNKLSTPALLSLFTVATEPDAEGGVWISQSGSYSDDSVNKSCGAAYIKDGKVTYYSTETPDTLPHNYVQEIKIDEDGNVWFGSFGGLTRFNKKTGEWKTWTKKDGLPAESVDNITFDSKGGVWIGCYPDTSTDANGDAHFAGGYAYLDTDGKITAYTSGTDENTDSKLLANFWVRDIAVDANDGAWVIRSGSYRNLANVGGRIDYVSPTGEVTHYTGQRLLNGMLTNIPNSVVSEIRTVDIDKNGGLWFGTTADGVFYCSKPYNVVRNYSGETMYWKNSDAQNNVYTVEIKDDTLYIGTAGGVLTGGIEYEKSTASDFAFLSKLKDASVETDFSDADNHWAKNEIYYLADRGIINGAKKDSFEPDSNITRAQFVKVLAFMTDIDASQYDTSKFSDVSGFYAPYISWANEVGIVNGVGGNKFEPDGLITREQIALMTDRYINYLNYDLAKTRGVAEFSDDDKINDYSYGAIQNLYSAELIDGKKSQGGYIYNPNGYATRGETAKIVASLLKNMLK